MARRKKPITRLFTRQQFEEGVARRCLQDAWLNLDKFRKTLRATRRFRGEVRDGMQVSRAMVAAYVNRDPNSVNVWFQGKSPDWSNLVLVMMGLGASWDHLAPQTSKSALIRSGWSYALRQVRLRLEGKAEAEIPPPSFTELQTLQELFVDPEWRVRRRYPEDRDASLRTVSQYVDRTANELDAVDQAWGDAWNRCLETLEFWWEQLNETHKKAD